MGNFDFSPVVGIERTATLTDQVIDAIISAATERRIPFGSRLVEAELARNLNVSRVPVREALRLLASQGLVEIEPYKGMCLMEVDERKLREILVVRHMIEELAVRLAVEELDSGRGSISGLQAAVGLMEVALQSGSAGEMAKSDVGFHRALLHLSANRTLQSVWEPLSRKFQIIVGIAWYSTDQKRIYQQHVNLLRLFKKPNLAKLLAAWKPHILEAIELGLPDVPTAASPQPIVKAASPRIGRSPT